MAIFYGNERTDNIFHGGLINLETLCKQVLEVTLRFKQTPSEPLPLTVNLAREIGYSTQTWPYVVDWGVEDDYKAKTLSNKMSCLDHEYTYIISGNKIFNITIYGDHLLKYYPFHYDSGDGDLSFEIDVREVSLDVEHH